MKIIYLILDGAAGDPDLGPTAYMKSEKPILDMLAKEGICGMVYTIRKGIAPESDAAVLSILGYDPEKDHPGRGPLEALGLGLELREGKEVAFRGNFATIDTVSNEIIDRRVGRTLTSEEARLLAEALDEMKLDNGKGYAKVKASIGHRVVVIIGHKNVNLSDNVSNTDPAYKKEGKVSLALKTYQKKIQKCLPLEPTEEAKRTCDLVNEFTEKAIKILQDHPINKHRVKKGLFPANAVLLRDAGGNKPKLTPISSIFFNLRFTALVEMPVEIGIARAAGMRIIELPPPSGNLKKDYQLRARRTLEALKNTDVIYVHLKGPDEPGHDGDIEKKIEAIEHIDRYYLGSIIDQIYNDDIGIIITSDHATPCPLKAHSDVPVPLLVFKKGIKRDQVTKFDEIECRKGEIGVLPHGYMILRKALDILL